MKTQGVVIPINWCYTLANCWYMMREKNVCVTIFINLYPKCSVHVCRSSLVQIIISLTEVIRNVVCTWPPLNASFTDPRQCAWVTLSWMTDWVVDRSIDLMTKDLSYMRAPSSYCLSSSSIDFLVFVSMVNGHAGEVAVRESTDNDMTEVGCHHSSPSSLHHRLRRCQLRREYGIPMYCRVSKYMWFF